MLLSKQLGSLGSRSLAGQARRPGVGAGLGRALPRSRRPAVPCRALLEIDQSAAAANGAVDVVAHHVNLLASVAEDAAVQTAAAAASSPEAGQAVSAVQEKGGGAGPFDAIAKLFESLLTVLDSGLVKLDVPYSYGFAIILLTIIVKAATFPLTQKQVQSTVALQALQPKVKELQAKYANDQQALQLETARLYREAGVNPLAGCLPTLATIPVFIGLYRALTLAAEDNLLGERFFWIPSLAGPATLADQQAGIGLQWLFPFVDGHPPIGWSTAGAYLVMPVLLVVSQFISQKIISPPPSDDPAAQQSQTILKVLPFMIGWFSLNVPAGLTLYWFVNNILSTAQQVYLKSTTKVNLPETAGGPSGSSQPYIAPKEERVKRVAGKDVNARKKRREDGAIDVEATSTRGSPSPEPSTATSSRKGNKFRARQAREAAAKAAAAAAAQNGSPAPSAAPSSSSSSSSSGSSNGGGNGSSTPPSAGAPEAGQKEKEGTTTSQQ